MKREDFILKIPTILIAFLTLMNIGFAEDCVTCEGQQKQKVSEIDKLSAAMSKITESHFVKVADLKVNHAGIGDLSAMVDETGSVLAIKFHYVDGKEVKDFTVSVEDFNKGKGITYPASKNNVSPLKLSAVIPPGIDGKSGGTFNLILGVNIDPPKYQTSTIKLFNKNGKWQIQNNDNVVKKVTLSPGISWASWDGTFKKVEFN